MAHHNIFRDELGIAYPSYGLALWEPDPEGQYDAVEVGDVGFVREGYFQRLFNILHPRDHPSHRNLSLVPEDHEQFQPIPDHIRTGQLRAGSGQNSNHLCSNSVTLDSRGLDTRPDNDSQVTFSCEGKQGALLSLPVSAQSADTIARAKFGEWMVKHIDAWFAFTRSLGLGVEKMEDIILVTGRHLTKSWVNVAFNQRRRDAGASFNAYVSRDSEIHLERQYVHGGELKLGPTGKDLPENQCIFIRGFRVARILGIWPRLRGEAGHAPDTSGHEPEPGSSTRLELVSVPASSNDPLHLLLQYIAEQSPHCDFALVHDDDMGYIGGDKTIHSSFLPMTQEFRCELSHGSTSGSGAVAAITRVATLSHPFEPERRLPKDSSTSAELSDSISPLTQGTPIPGYDRGIAYTKHRPVSSSQRQTHYTPTTLGSDLQDPVRDLNNYLQCVQTPNNLVPYLNFSHKQKGPNNQAVHTGTYTFRNVVVGTGEGVTMNAAKRVAATQALQYFHTHPVPE